MDALNERGGSQQVRGLLDHLAAVVVSPEARAPIEAVNRSRAKRDKEPVAAGSLADAQRWIDDARRELDLAEGDEGRVARLLSEVKRVHAFVMHDREDHVVLGRRRPRHPRVAEDQGRLPPRGPVAGRLAPARPAVAVVDDTPEQRRHRGVGLVSWARQVIVIWRAIF
jgi:hypothetical protein